MYRSFFKDVFAADRRHIELNAVGMTGDKWKAHEIAAAESERDEIRERLGIHSDEFKAKERSQRTTPSNRRPRFWRGR